MRWRVQMKAAVMIDGPNLFWSLEHMKKKLDFFELIMFLEKIGFDKMILEFFFDKSRPGPIRDNRFLDYLKEIGFEVIEVRKKKYFSKMNGPSSKSRTDQTLTVRTMEHLYEGGFDALVLFSGDSDFEELVLACRRKHKKIIIISTSDSLSWELKGEADDLLLLDQLPDNAKIFQRNGGNNNHG